MAKALVLVEGQPVEYLTQRESIQSVVVIGGGMGNQAISVRKVAVIAGAICSYWIGSGFASGQEVLQFFSVYGLKGIVGSVIFLVVMGSTTYVLCGAGQRMKFANPYQVFDLYCGKVLGEAYTWYTVVLIYCVFVVMLSGAGATINQYFHVPTYVGTVVIAILAFGTAILGIERLIRIIGVIGPTMIVFIAIVGVAAIANVLRHSNVLADAGSRMSSLGFKSASANWAWSAVLYTFGALICGIPFLVDCGASARSVKEARIAGITGSVAFTTAIVLLIISELVFSPLIAGQQVPTLAMANHLSPLLGLLFTVLIVVCIYSSVSSFLLMTVRKFAQNRTRKSYFLTAVFAAFGAICGGILPFDKLINVIYPLAGYSAMLLVLLVIVRMLRERIARHASDSGGRTGI